MSQPTIFIVQPREESGITAKPRLVRAPRRSAAADYLLEAWSIEKATPEQCVEMGRDGAVIEDVAP